MVFTITDHIGVGVVSNGEQMGRHLSPPLILILGHHLSCIDGKATVGVDSDTEETGVGVDQRVLVSHPQVVEYAGLVQEGHVGHVSDELVLGRVHLLAFVLVDSQRGSSFCLDLYIVTLVDLISARANPSLASGTHTDLAPA